MTIFKRIDINTAKERERINRASFNGRQRRALLKLMDLFEAGDWQACLNHIHSGAFPYNKKEEYPETEHIGVEVGRILRDVSVDNFYTQAQLLEEAREKIKNETTHQSRKA